MRIFFLYNIYSILEKKVLSNHPESLVDESAFVLILRDLSSFTLRDDSLIFLADRLGINLYTADSVASELGPEDAPA